MADLKQADVKAVFTLLPMEEVHHGSDCIARLGATLGRHGVERALLITGRTLSKSSLLNRVKDAATGRIVGVFAAAEQHVPRLSVLAAAQMARQLDADAVISFGGGSSSDTAKGVVLALAERISDVRGFDRQMIEFRYPDQLRVPAMQGRAIPSFAIATTLSAGEFTHFIGITDETRKVKDLYIDRQLTAKAVFMDAQLTLETPDWLWLSSGMRAVDHCVEALCSTTAHSFTDALAAHSLGMLARMLRVTRAQPADMAARTQSQIAAWMSVFGLANVTLGLSHGIGHQLGARCAVPHGHTSCVMMHHTMRFNRQYTATRQAWIAEILGVDTRAMDQDTAAESAAAAILKLTRDLGQPVCLKDVGVGPEEFAALAADAMRDLIVATNPRPIKSETEVIALLQSAYEV